MALVRQAAESRRHSLRLPYGCSQSRHAVGSLLWPVQHLSRSQRATGVMCAPVMYQARSWEEAWLIGRKLFMINIGWHAACNFLCIMCGTTVGLETQREWATSYLPLALLAKLQLKMLPGQLLQRNVALSLHNVQVMAALLFLFATEFKALSFHHPRHHLHLSLLLLPALCMLAAHGVQRVARCVHLD